MRDTLILAALLAATAVQAAPLAPPTDAPLAVAQSTPSDDDEDDPSPTPANPTPAPTNTPATGTTTAPKADAPAAAAAPTADAAANAEAQRLVSGAPLFNPNVAVHIVEKKEFSDSRKTE
ncbi:MAG TPA: hypothetical protein VGE37_10825, partial [Archangium sp.]